MSTNNTIRLLILNDSRQEAERLISMLHNAGHPVRAQHVDSEDALNKLLQEKAWDLLIGLDTTTNLKPADAIRAIKRMNKDIPIILQTDVEGSHAIVEGMKIGANDVVRLDEDQHLLLVIQREINAREDRENRRVAQRRQREIEKRNQQLLDSSRDAIAFVQDGMFLYANESFAELLDHESRDELECMPVIDIIKKDDQDKVKRFLKNFSIKGSDAEASKLDFHALSPEGTEKPLSIDVRMANYDEESCIQFLIRTSDVNSEELEAQLAQIKNQDIATGLYNKNYFIESLESLVDKAVSGEFNSAIYQIGILDFTDIVKDKVGISSMDIVLGTIASYARGLVKKGDILCRYSEDTFMLLAPKIDAQKAVERASELCKQLRENIVDVDGSTMQFNYAVGVSLVNETTSDTDTPINHAHKALELVRAEIKEGKDSLAKIYEPEIKKEDLKKDIATTVQLALDKGKFKLLFQPILSLRGSDKEHYEVLLRMIDSEGEEISPDDFLVAAAKIGATTKIDRWVILNATKMLAEHREKGNKTNLIVNLSRESMLDASLAPWLGVAFKTAKLPPDSIIFQLNEVDVNDHLNVAKTFTEQLVELGCGFSISRFGCALNPFNALKHVKATHIKVDGSFTQELQKGAEETDSLGELIKQLLQEEKITIVPFVENASILSKLWQSGVHYIQGYYLQEPADGMTYDFDTES